MVRVATYDGKYCHLWQKYRPMLLKLMVDAGNEPQSYQFNLHEFADLNNQKRTGYSFKLEIYRNQRQNKITSTVASDLLSILQSSVKADELTYESKYIFRMDSKLKLEVTRVSVE